MYSLAATTLSSATDHMSTVPLIIISRRLNIGGVNSNVRTVCEASQHQTGQGGAGVRIEEGTLGGSFGLLESRDAGGVVSGFMEGSFSPMIF